MSATPATTSPDAVSPQLLAQLSAITGCEFHHERARLAAQNSSQSGHDPMGQLVHAAAGQTELEGLVQLKMPLQQREAEGRVDVADSTISRLNLEKRFTQDRIVADVRDSFVAVDAAYNALGKTRRNVDLARQLQTAEQERLKLGATDLLNLQIREQFTFDAEMLEVEAQADYFRAQANYDAAVAADAPTTFAK